jgi:hypothetical protein
VQGGCGQPITDTLLGELLNVIRVGPPIQDDPTGKDLHRQTPNPSAGALADVGLQFLPDPIIPTAVHVRWNKSNVRFTVQGSQLLDHSFPEFEDFVFVAVYLRQLIAKKDCLLEDAVTRYCRFVDCQIRLAWVQRELVAFKGALDGGAFMLPGYTVRDLFDAFMYGAALRHKIPPVGDPKRQRFLDIYDNQPRHRLLSALNMSLKTLMNYVGHITEVIYRDYSHWLPEHGLPLPDTRWHNKLFEIKATAEPGAAGDGGRDPGLS